MHNIAIYVHMKLYEVSFKPWIRYSFKELGLDDMASQFNQLTSSKLAVTRTSSALVVDNCDSEPIYDDVIELSQRVPPSVAAKPKQSLITEQGSTHIYGNIGLTKENTVKHLPPPVAAKPKSPMAERRNTLPSTGPKQHTSLVEERSNTLFNNVISSEGFTAKSSPKIPPPVANKPKSPFMGRKSSPLYNKNIVNVTESSISPAATKQTLFNTPLHNAVSTTQATIQSFMEKKDIPLYGNTGAVSPIPSPTKKFVQPNQQMSSFIEQRGNPLHNSGNVSNVTEPSESICPAATGQALPNTSLHNEAVSSEATEQSFMDKKEIPLYGNTGTVLPVPSSTQKSAQPNQQMSPFMERRSYPTDNVAILTEQSTSPVATTFGKRTPPVPPLRIDSIPTMQVTAHSFMEKKRYGYNSAESSSHVVVASPMQKSAPNRSPDSNLYYNTNIHDGEYPLHSIKQHHPLDYDYVDCKPNLPTTLSQDQNKACLKSLSREDILRLLDKMNLSQHMASFQEEQVNGEVLSILTGDDLKELGVMKGVQLKRLLQLIAGTMSAKDILEN